MTKISNEAIIELRKIKAALDDAYNKLEVVLYEKNLATKVSYSEVKPSELISENFSYISKTIRELQNSELVGD
tara:strand:- start:1051 stop:1269 length:219 start_codon:yes stop_codon:yes gene_type:complete